MKPSSIPWISTAIAVAGVLLFSTKAIFAKLMYAEGAPAIDVLALRMIFSLPIYFVILLRLGRDSIRHEPRQYLWLLFFGVIGYYLASFFDFQGLEYIKAGLERLILFIYPTLVMIISYFAFGHKLSRAQVLGLIATYLGILVVFLPEASLNDDKVYLGGFLVFLSALTYGSYIVGSGWLIPKFGATRFTTLAMIISSIAVLTHYFIATTDATRILDYDSQVYFLGSAMAILSTVLPSYFVSYAIKGLGANRFSIFGSLGPISTIILAYLFLGERLTILQLIGGMIVISGVVVAERNKSRVKA